MISPGIDKPASLRSDPEYSCIHPYPCPPVLKCLLYDTYTVISQRCSSTMASKGGNASSEQLRENAGHITNVTGTMSTNPTKNTSISHGIFAFCIMH
jgi:hypothetical protein